MTWRCFHCDEVFTDTNQAAEHFGTSLDDIAACKLNAIEGGLVKIIRDQEEELRRYRREDTEAARQFYALGADHAQALRREEEKGYARGLTDGRMSMLPQGLATDDGIKGVVTGVGYPEGAVIVVPQAQGVPVTTPRHPDDYGRMIPCLDYHDGKCQSLTHHCEDCPDREQDTFGGFRPQSHPFNDHMK